MVIKINVILDCINGYIDKEKRRIRLSFLIVRGQSRVVFLMLIVGAMF